MKTVGVALIEMLEHLGTEFVFGIPGVHTVELYRGLAASDIRHITPRHEQGAGFMADGYARASGKPGVCLLITGPGLTNAITAMAQAMQDSVPMLVITGVNPADSHGKKRGLLHELPDQHGLICAMTPHSYSLRAAADLPDVLRTAYEVFASARPGPVHIEIPTDLMAAPMPDYQMPQPSAQPPRANAAALTEAADLIATAKSPLILAGGGCQGAGADTMCFAEALDAPVLSTANARAHLGVHPLHAPASASIPAVREYIAKADLVIGLGTEMGPTDYDVFVDGSFPELQRFIRIDIDAARLTQDPICDVGLHGDVTQTLADLTPLLPPRADLSGAARTAAIIAAATPPSGSAMAADLEILKAVADALPACTIVGDSTQIVYSGNLLLPPEALPAGWFNSATGYGTLGYGPPAAVGAALARPNTPVVCLVGDGGLQFSIAELASATDADVPVIFLLWNNSGYREIETYMKNAAINPIGVTPSCPDLMHIATAYGLTGLRARDLPSLKAALTEAALSDRPSLIECIAPDSDYIPAHWGG
ncbi:5-guanidino-2-oxopentanoate decarboxylase [Thalassobius sp. Cn5-15]|uniref:5-guanidino-2-oxopentanoate decarboxylase n=1 Tax=Thalassobius sp. Cn5-15 TaxID=2917763 RepID=UPI001EF1ACED|nr:5-guanidino-2-oxopentanoate decarboxylase [Thalassobius sp. Cn5-15]MCG7493051.1 5-guanidino-2-oxopentanoate decarboxylase [Thalassobius sp. Cn5-15]